MNYESYLVGLGYYIKYNVEIVNFAPITSR